MFHAKFHRSWQKNWGRKRMSIIIAYYSIMYEHKHNIWSITWPRINIFEWIHYYLYFVMCDWITYSSQIIAKYLWTCLIMKKALKMHKTGNVAVRNYYTNNVAYVHEMFANKIFQDMCKYISSHGLGLWPGHVSTTWGWFWVHKPNGAHVRPWSKKWTKKPKSKKLR